MPFITWLIQFVLKGLGLGQKPADTTVKDLSASNATATTNLQTEAAANDQLVQAAQARAAVDAQRVRNDPHSADVTTDPTAAVNLSPDAHFRD
jgi:hypothetical protein